MTVGVDVDRAVAMAVGVKMHPITPQPPQHMRAEADQHDADGGLQRPRQMLGNSVPEQYRRTGKDEQRQGMAKSPGQAMPDNVPHVGPPRGDTRHRRDMIGLQRMLHAEQKPQPQNSEHVSPARPCRLYMAPVPGLVRANFTPEYSGGAAIETA